MSILGVSFRSRWKKLSLAGFALLLLQACSVLSCSNRNGVTGGQGSPTNSGTQTETSSTLALTGGVSRIVVAFNDETNEGSTITYTASNRHVTSGASLMGWSYSDTQGASWTYGGKVPAPPDWPVLWGDPAITTSQSSYGIVWMSNLAVPSAKLPPGGIDGYLDYTDSEAYIGGACIAKSTDAGKAFAVYQCVTDTSAVAGVGDSTQGHFYDGGSMVSSNTGEVFAAFVDVATSQIAVWRSPNDTGKFSPIAPPFPGMYVGAHPRLRAAQDGSVYLATQVLVQDGPSNVVSQVMMNRWSSGAWGKPIQVSNNGTVFYGSVDFGTTVDGSELTWRVGNSFSFDVGASSPNGSDAVRLLYLREISGHRSLAASACYADLHQCFDVPQWSFQGGGPGNTAVDIINPELAAWPGFIGLPATWQATWAYHYGTTSTVNLSRATLGYFPNSDNPLVVIPVDILQNTPLCSDTRGYWGDYDSMLLIGWQGTSSLWMRFITDSSQGCPTRWGFVGNTQHLQQANYAY